MNEISTLGSTVVTIDGLSIFLNSCEFMERTQMEYQVQHWKVAANSLLTVILLKTQKYKLRQTICLNVDKLYFYFVMKSRLDMTEFE